MKLKNIVTLLLLSVAALSCGIRDRWQTVEYNGCGLRCDSLHSADEAGRPFECRPWFEGDTLVVHLSGLDLGWAWITVKIHGGRFSAEADGVPYHTWSAPSFETIGQRLCLAKESYAPGDTLCGSFDFRFRLTYADNGKPDDRGFRGTFCEVIRPKDFDPFAEENYLIFDLPTALHEMGAPLARHVFDMENVTEFSIELLNRFPPSAEIVCEELTWDTSSTREISDEGKERLTIWYVEQDDRWMPVDYREWNTDWQF